MRMHQRAVLIVIGLVFVHGLAAQSGADQQFQAGVQLYQSGQHRRALERFEQALDAYGPVGNLSGIMNAALWAGAASYHLGQYDDARAYYDQSYAAASESGDDAVSANVATARANLENGLLEYAAAGFWYGAAADHFSALGETTQARQSREYGAYVLVLAGDYDAALPVFLRALASPAGRSRVERAWLAAMAGQALYGLGDLTEALDRYTEAASEQADAARGRPSVEQAQYEAWIGRVLFELGGDSDAIAALEESADIARAARTPSDESRAIATIGMVHATHARFAEAIAAYDRSLEIARAAKIDEFVIPALQSLAQLAEDAGNPSLAASYQQQLIEHARSSGDRRLEADSINERGVSLLDAGDAAGAAQAFRAALQLERELRNTESEAVVLFNLGVALEESGRPDEAIEILEQSLAITEDEDALLVLGDLLDTAGRAGAAASILERLLTYYEDDDQQFERMNLLNNLGNALSDSGRYPQADRRYTDAMAIAMQLGDDEAHAIHLHNRGRARSLLARFDDALSDYTAAGRLAPDRSGIAAQIENSTGELYRAWGWFDRSLFHYERALEILGGDGAPDDYASILNNMGQAVRLSGDPAGSIELYENALAAIRGAGAAGTTEGEAIYLSNLGEAYRQLGAADRARELYQEALRLDLEAQRARGINVRSSNLGLLELEAGNYRASVPYFERALAYWRSTGERREEAGALNNLGYAYSGMEEYGPAEEVFSASVEIHEELRATASGTARQEYLQNQIDVYRNLALVQFAQGRIWEALHSVELSRSKVLLEQMGDSPIGRFSLAFDRFLAIRDRLTADTAILSVSRLDDQTYLICTITVDGLEARYQTVDPSSIAGSQDVPALLTEYRALLAAPFLTRSERSQVAEYAEWLHTSFVAPGIEDLDGVSTLIIVPDGELGAVPFETFQEDGAYLIESYDVAYAPSVFVALEAMERRYADDRREMLALGGAQYSPGPSGALRSSGASAAGASIAATYARVINDPLGQRLIVAERLRGGAALNENYRSLGLDEWSNLPGAEQEVVDIAAIVGDVDLVTGADVRESLVKELSASGELSAFRTIHLATHGVVVPDVPELSAVVLSQGVDDGEDGYLTMSEIAELELAADFVNLSACETGLGRIYRGEGIVGLTQAFLIAGAKSLSVSLWQIDDEVTRSFMTGLYELVVRDGASYVEAISEMKRRFLSDRLTAQPYYWAPFAFYGDYRVGPDQ